ncbi:UNVERIFIED_CONTAM: hypothetical protein Sradi_2051000 [Sesamum radiatum]|uniref:Retrotransposon gag domain-containing protein n=1 Tax=Sesamum radiatum TaxID=300843 RepID=A0AAW2TH96_SESRA
MIEDASARAAESAIDRFLANIPRERSPLRSPRRGGGTPSAPEDNESRENDPQDMSIEEGYSKQATPPLAPPQRRREYGEHAERVGRRVEGAASSGREKMLHANRMIPSNRAIPIILAVAPARKSPFSMQILTEALPQGIRIPSLAEYDGTGDPVDHFEKFLAKADLLDMSDARYCKISCTTLSGKAMAWFNQLPIHTIENFEQLSQRFLHHFSINKDILKQLRTYSQ